MSVAPHARSSLEHLALHAEVDAALDTFPYNGATTTCEALWQGVPVVTLAGRVHAGRVGASLLTNVGLPELVAPDADAFVATAAALADDAARLRAARKDLRGRMRASPLSDARGLAAGLEGAFPALWDAG